MCNITTIINQILTTSIPTPPPPPKHRFTIYLMTDELITPITQMHVHGIEFEKKIGYSTHI